MVRGAPKILSAAPSVNCAGAKLFPPFDVSALTTFRSRVSSLSESASDFTRSTVKVVAPFKTLRSNRTSRSRSTWRTRTCSGFEYECASRAPSVFEVASAGRNPFTPSVDEFRQAITNSPSSMTKQTRDCATFIFAPSRIVSSCAFRRLVPIIKPNRLKAELLTLFRFGGSDCQSGFWLSICELSLEYEFQPSHRPDRKIEPNSRLHRRRHFNRIRHPRLPQPQRH